MLRRNRLLAISARLQAEIAFSDQMQLPTDLLTEADDPFIRAIIQAQKAELTARRASQFNQEEVLRKKIAGLRESITGYQAQVTSSQAQLALFQEEINAKRNLIDQQLIRTSDYLALKRAEVGLTGQVGQFLARVGDAKERISRSEQEIAQIRSTAIEKAVEKLRGTETELDDLREQILAAEDVVKRTEVRAPVHGIVIKMNQHTQGGVISPGGVILELLPINEELIIEARLNPTEIIHVKEGQAALVRLSALNQRLTPMIKPTLFTFRADTVSDQGTRRNPEANFDKIDLLCGFGWITVICTKRLIIFNRCRGCRPTFTSKPGNALSSRISCGPSMIVYRAHFASNRRERLPMRRRSLNAETESACKFTSRSTSGLALLWQIIRGTGFPNQIFSDSWVVGLMEGRPWRARGVGNASLGVGLSLSWSVWVTRRGNGCVRFMWLG